MYKIGTLLYVTVSMNHLTSIGAREEMRKLGEGNIIDYIGEDDHKTQLFLEYVYLGNRVGANVNSGILYSEIIFATWTKKWWIDLWEKLQPLVEKERERRKDRQLYAEFEDFVEKTKRLINRP